MITPLPSRLAILSFENPYPEGTLLRYRDRDHPHTNSSVKVRADGTFIEFSRGGKPTTIPRPRYLTYDAWIATLPARAQSDLGITEIPPRPPKKNFELELKNQIIQELRAQNDELKGFLATSLLFTAGLIASNFLTFLFK